MRWIVAVCALLLMTSTVALADVPKPPIVTAALAGATIQDVTIDTHGVTDAAIAEQYLSMRAGGVLTQRGADQDYDNLLRVVGYIPKLTVLEGDQPNTVRLHWDIAAKPLAPTAHPYYNDKPLVAPFQGIGFIVTSPPVSRRGANLSAYTQLAQRADVFSALYTIPLHIDAKTGTEGDLLGTYSAARGVYRQLVPPNKNIFSWSNLYQIDYWRHNFNDTQLEAGVRYVITTTALPSGLDSPFLYQTWRAPSRNTALEVGLLHGCVAPAPRWYPPYCSFQYRVQALDSIGIFGSTNQYASISGGAAAYFRVGNSALALQGRLQRTGGVLPESFVNCAYARGYPKPFCGTDSQILQVEYRIAQALPAPLKFIPFYDDAASRIRGQILPIAGEQFIWHSDVGLGVAYKDFIRIDIAYGSQGGRVTFALEGQSY